jgi:hypothetical protein
MDHRQELTRLRAEGRPQYPREAEDPKLPSLAARIKEITVLLANDGPARESVRTHALRMIKRERLFYPFWREARQTEKYPAPELVLALAKARLEGARARRQVARDRPESPQPSSKKGVLARLGATLVIPWVLAVLIAAVTAIFATVQHRQNKVFDADYERTVGIIEELTDLMIKASDLQANLMGEEKSLDNFRINRFINRANDLADSLTRTTDLLSLDEDVAAQQAQAEAYIEIEKLRFCLATQRTPALNREKAEQALSGGLDRFQPPLSNEVKVQLLSRLKIEYPCGEKFDITPLDDLRSATREFLFSKLGSQVFDMPKKHR